MHIRRLNNHIAKDSNPTLQEAICAKGGGINAFARHAVAALLNSEHTHINCPMTKSQVITLVHNAIVSGNSLTIESVNEQLEGYNSLEGRIDAHGNPVSP